MVRSGRKAPKWAFRTTNALSLRRASRFHLLGVCAAPHLPAGILSPYSDGERDAVIDDFANCQRCKMIAEAAISPFSPSLYGEKCPAGQ